MMQPLLLSRQNPHWGQIIGGPTPRRQTLLSQIIVKAAARGESSWQVSQTLVACCHQNALELLFAPALHSYCSSPHWGVGLL